MMIVMLPLFFLAMYEKDGQPLEVVVEHFIQTKFVRPKVRPYQTDNYIVANEDFELIKVGRYKRATKESFEKWYQNQTRYQLAEDRQERS